MRAAAANTFAAADANGCRMVVLQKEHAAVKLGIVLVDREVVQAPVIKELKAGQAALPGELHVGDCLLKINGQPCALGHADATRRLRVATLCSSSRRFLSMCVNRAAIMAAQPM